MMISGNEALMKPRLALRSFGKIEYVDVIRPGLGRM